MAWDCVAYTRNLLNTPESGYWGSGLEGLVSLAIFSADEFALQAQAHVRTGGADSPLNLGGGVSETPCFTVFGEGRPLDLGGKSSPSPLNLGGPWAYMEFATKAATNSGLHWECGQSICCHRGRTENTLKTTVPMILFHQGCDQTICSPDEGAIWRHQSQPWPTR